MYFDDKIFFTTEDMETNWIGIMDALEDKLVSMNMTSEQIEEVMEDVVIPYKIMYTNEIERLEDEIEDLQMEYDNKMPVNNSIKKVMKDRLTKLKYSSGVYFKVIDYNNYNIKDETFMLIINSSIDTLEDRLLNNYNEYFYITNSGYYNEEILFSPTQAIEIVNIAKDRVLSKPYKLTEGYFVGLENGCIFCSESKEIAYVLSKNDVTAMINWLTDILLIGGYNI